MRILVFGATGQTGRAFVRQALAASHNVTAFVREPLKLDIASANLSVMPGNVRDAEAVRSAMPGHDAVVSTLGVSTPLKHDADVVTGIGNVVAAMQASRVRRLIYQSFIGVRESRAAVGFVLRFIAPLPLREEIADHEEKERIVKGSTLDWTIVRPPKLTNGPQTGRYRAGLEIRTWAPVPMLSRADVAAFMLKELEHPAYVRAAPRLLP